MSYRRTTSIAVALIALFLASCASTSAETAEAPSPTTSEAPAIEPSSTTTTEPAPLLPNPIHADPVTNMLHDRSNEVYLYYSMVKQTGFIDHIDCVTEAAMTAVGPDRLRVDGVLNSKDQLQIDQLTSDEVDALSAALSDCRTPRILRDVLAIDHPRHASCISEELPEGQLFLKEAATGTALGELTSVQDHVAECEAHELWVLEQRITPTLVEDRLVVAYQMISAANRFVPFTEYERECAMLSVADRISTTFVEKYLASGESSVLDYIAATSADLHTRDSGTHMIDGWYSCVESASMLNQMADLGFTEEDLNCLDYEQHNLDVSFPLTDFLSGWSTDTEVKAEYRELLDRCGART